MNIKDLLKDNIVKFLHFKKGELWYEIIENTTTYLDIPHDSPLQYGDEWYSNGTNHWSKFVTNDFGKTPDEVQIISGKLRRPKPTFKFPVPINDIGDGIFMAEDKAILFMRYVRKFLGEMEEGKVETKSVEFSPVDPEIVDQMAEVPTISVTEMIVGDSTTVGVVDEDIVKNPSPPVIFDLPGEVKNWTKGAEVPKKNKKVAE